MLINQTTVEYDVGIDEAGRGPVLGPMIYGAVIWPTGTETKSFIANFNITDSKVLSAAQREEKLRHIETLRVELKGSEGAGLCLYRPVGRIPFC